MNVCIPALARMTHWWERRFVPCPRESPGQRVDLRRVDEDRRLRGGAVAAVADVVEEEFDVIVAMTL